MIRKEGKYIYTTPDGGITMYRNESGKYETKVRIGNESYKPIQDCKTALVLGAGGFIGSHMVKQLKSEGYWVRGVDLKLPEFSKTEADDFIVGDLRDSKLVGDVIEWDFDEVYQFAADMGGAGYLFTGENDADVMHNSGLINLNVSLECVKKNVG